MKHHSKLTGGFSLLEVVLVLFVLGVLAASLAPTVRDTIAQGRAQAEKRNLTEIVDTITASFESNDLSGLNIAAMPGTIGVADVPTVFSTSTQEGYGNANPNDWFVKVARGRALSVALGAPVMATTQPELARIVLNDVGNPRRLFAGPDEPGRQRFLLVSLLARNDQLVLPTYETNAAWFEALWNHDWENRSAGIPIYWAGRLTGPQAAAWTSGSGGLTQVWKLNVRRIVLPKYRVTVNNNHPTETAYLSCNNTPQVWNAPANAGARVTPEILGGRLVIINRGASWPGVEALRFNLHENPTVTLQ